MVRVNLLRDTAFFRLLDDNGNVVKEKVLNFSDVSGEVNLFDDYFTDGRLVYRKIDDKKISVRVEFIIGVYFDIEDDDDSVGKGVAK